jgi:hypothetical protein
MSILAFGLCGLGNAILLRICLLLLIYDYSYFLLSVICQLTEIRSDPIRSDPIRSDPLSQIVQFESNQVKSSQVEWSQIESTLNLEMNEWLVELFECK